MNERALAAFNDEMDKIALINPFRMIGAARKGFTRATSAGATTGQALLRGAKGAGHAGAASFRSNVKALPGVIQRGTKAVSNAANQIGDAATNVRGAMGKVIGGGADAAPAVAGAGQNLGMGATHFGTNLLGGEGGGVQNWWQQASDMQKLKTLGAGVGAAGAYNLAQTGIGGRRPGVQIG